jgi:glycosyltransferase involved in cell wall biosynthesis
MPRVSVIVPAYNAESYIAEALQSVIQQSYRDWEVVVADDASSDGTAHVASKVAPGLKLLRTDENGGIGAARNRAIAASSGELLAFLDADDLWRFDYLQELVELYDRSVGSGLRVGVVACNARILTPDGYAETTYMDAVGASDGIGLRRLLKSNPIFVSALTPRVVVDAAGGFSAELDAAQDYDLWIRIMELGYRVVATPEPIAVYRLTPNSVSSFPGREARALQEMYERALDRGRLTKGESRIARRQIRLYRLVEAAARESNLSKRRYRLRTRLLRLRVAVENPGRWLELIRRLLGRQHTLEALVRR